MQPRQRQFLGRAIWMLCLGAACAGALAEEDPAVTRARELARQQYELEKIARQTEEARKKLADEEALRRAIALTRQGVISLYNPGDATSGEISFTCRWKLWDGTFTEWTQTHIVDKKSLFFSKLGGLKFEVKFSSSGGGEKTYLLETAQLPNDVKPAFEDGKPHHFSWAQRNSLDLFTGKPAKW